MEESEFEQQIIEYEDMMFGLTLYQETSPKWVQRLQKKSYKNIKIRGEKALREAKNILLDIKRGKDIQERIMCFEWPIIIDDMRFRIDVMLQSYNSIFPDRPKDKSLSEQEMIALRNEAMNRI
jgi:hypothetical protein